MKLEYRGYTIDVKATIWADRFCGAKILIWPIIEAINALRQHSEIEGYSNKYRPNMRVCNGRGRRGSIE